MCLSSHAPPAPLSYPRTDSHSDRMNIYVSDAEPTEDTLTFLRVPYTRFVPDDDFIQPFTLAELVSHKLTDWCVRQV